MDKRAARGEIQTQHILLKTPEKSTPEIDAKVKAKADSIYLIAMRGDNFDELAKMYSEDKYTSNNAGKLPWFGTGKMVEDFENAAFNLAKNGDISKPVKTQYGYHILKRIDKKEIQSYNELKDALKKKIEKDSRSEISKQAYIEKIKKDNSYQMYNDAYAEIVDKTSIDINKPTWKPDSLLNTLNRNLFAIGGRSFTQKEFVKYMVLNKSKQKPQLKDKMIATLYDAMVAAYAMDIEEQNLEQKNPEFKTQLKEYRDGILLFDLMERKVWNAAIRDTTGLKGFYEANKSKYIRNESVQVATFKCANAATAAAVKENIKTYTSKTKNDFQTLVSKDAKALTIEENYYERGQNVKVDDMNWTAGTTKDITNASGSVDVYLIIQNTTGTYKTLNDSKGFIVADYQEQLEKNWISDLKSATPVNVNEATLQSIFKK
jgi:peptidyl-prolyl cis-trans isomerase SurA